MAENDNFLIANILYNLREKYYNNAIQIINQGIKSHGNDTVLKFYYAIGLLLQDRIHEAVRDLEFLKTKDDVAVGTHLALIYAHKKFTSVDRETITDLDSKVKELRKQADEKGLYYAGFFWFIIGRSDKAKEYVDRAIKMNDNCLEALSLRGWMEIPNDPKQASLFFEKAISVNSKYIDSMFGIAKCRETINAFTQALDVVNRILVANPNYLSAVIEKMKLLLSNQEWDQCLEVAQRALLIDSNCLEALRYQILELLCREGRYTEAAEAVGNLYQILERIEPNSAYLYYDYSRVFARICGKSASVLQRTEQYLEKAITLDQNNATYFIELGFQKVAQDKTKDAIKHYRAALKIEENNIDALLGKLRCQIAEDQLDESVQQIEFLTEVQQNLNLNAEFPYLKAILSKKKNSLDKTMKLIDEAIGCHFKGLKGLPLGKDYFYNLNPDFILELVKEQLNFVPSSPSDTGGTPDPVLKKCSSILEALTKAVPGLIPGLYYLAKLKYIMGDFDAAKTVLQKILSKDASHSDSHILMAQTKRLQNGKSIIRIWSELQFQIKNHPTYHLIKARILKLQGQTEEALKTLQLAMQLPGVKKTSKAVTEITMQDRVAVYLELADVYLSSKLQHEATKIMQDAINEFRGTSEETRITIANVDLSLSRGDIDGALNMLKKIDQSQPYYVQAREKMADIYLNHRKDKRLYIATYKELAEKFQNPHTLVILGDAYMSIVEPDKAVEVYESALRKNPKDASLAKKIGQALIKSHCYAKAISYYEAALKSGHQKLLRFDLAQLYTKLNYLDKAERQIVESLKEDQNELQTLAMVGKCCFLMCEINQKQGNMESISNWLEKSREIYLKVLKKAQIEDPDALQEHQNMLSTILKRFAQHYADLRMNDSVEKMLKEAINANDNDYEAQILLANHYLSTDNLELCQSLCQDLLQTTQDASNEVNLMLANLLFRKGNIEQAIQKFKQLFQKQPDQYEALISLVKLSHRAGKIEESFQFIEKIEKEMPKAASEAGFNFAKGLYYQLCCKPTEALKYYNKCRGDKKYGANAAIEMTNVCLNPDNEIRADEDWKKKSPNQKVDGAKVAQETAFKLLQGASEKVNDVRYKVAENYCIMHTGEKQNVERALENFLNLENVLKDNISVLRGIAECCMVLKQAPKARNHLKRIAKIQWTPDDADDIEKCWLLLAATYMSNGKFDQALELCRKCTEYNKSCTRAYEFIGQMMEKEAAYKDASENYEKAWNYSNKNQPAVGYKLAFNYLKARRFTDAIDICHFVIEKFPDFPKIRKDILEKARQSLRT